MSKVDYIKKLITDLTPEERANIDSYLVEGIVNDAEQNKHQYGLELASEYIDEAKKLVNNWGSMQGLSTGYKTLDSMTHGMVGGEVIIIGGATSNGKTSLAVNIAGRVVAKNVPVLFVTLEMTKAQLTSRLLFTNDSFEDHSAYLSYQKADELNWKSVDGLISTAVKELGVQLVIIDHLHYFTRELNNVAEDLGRITKEFKKNASRYNIPIILISHTRKGAGDSIDDLRGSSYIAQDADIVMMVSRSSKYPTSIAVSIKKNRNRGFNPDNDETYLNFDKTKITEGTEVPSFGDNK